MDRAVRTLTNTQKKYAYGTLREQKYGYATLREQKFRSPEVQKFRSPEV
jgi:hypothetical protein